MNSTLQGESEFERSILFSHCLHKNMYPMVKIPSSFLLYVCLTIQSSIVPCPIPWPGGCNDRVVMTMVEGDTRVTVRHDIRMVTQCAVAVPPSWADQSVPPGVAPVTSVTTAHWGAHNRITLHNTDQLTIYCNMPLNATAWKTKSKSLLLISPVGEDMWHDGVALNHPSHVSTILISFSS